MIVTDIQKRRHRLTALFLDGQPTLIDTETLLLSGIGVGKELSQQELADLQERSQYNRAYEKALYLLEYRAHSRKELLTKILREYPPAAAESAVARVTELGLIDDTVYAADLAEEYVIRKGYGVHRAQMELQKRGIDRDLATAVLSEIQTDPIAQLTELIPKKYHPIPTDPKGVQKVVSAMVRNGYEFSQVRQALKQLAEEIEVEEPWQ
ncbi:MAG: regulatory protein RecX [Clostridia bacterium]|nr:regulatory protein RecX [Clostridia bacterium]